MATTVFTTWAAYRDFLLDKLASMDWGQISNHAGLGMLRCMEEMSRLRRIAPMR